jgi:hypothetical protein
MTGMLLPKILNKISSRGIATGSSSIDRRHPSVIYVNVSKTNGTKANALSSETAVSAGANLITMKNRYKKGYKHFRDPNGISVGEMR